MHTKEELAMASLLARIAIYWDAVGPEIAEVERNGMKLNGQELHLRIAPLICQVLQAQHCHACADAECGDNQTDSALLEKYGETGCRYALQEQLEKQNSGRFDSSKPNQANTPRAGGSLRAEDTKREILKRGSAHYKAGDIEPIDYMFANALGEPFCLGCIIKYATRCNLSGTKRKDLEKIIHYTEFILEHMDD